MKKALLLIYLLAGSLDAEDTLNHNEKEFFSRYVSAVNSGDTEKIKALLHPENLKCINSNNKSFYDNFFSKLAKKTIPQKYDFKVAQLT